VAGAELGRGEGDEGLGVVLHPRVYDSRGGL
jgi:hypothetical protein